MLYYIFWTKIGNRFVMTTVRDNFVDDRVLTEFVENHSAAGVCHLPIWREILREGLGHRSWYLTAWQDEKLRGILPLYRVKSFLFGKFLVSIPAFTYGGIVADDDESAGVLWDHAVQLAETLGVKLLEIRQVEPVNPNWPTRRDKVSYHLALGGSAGLVWDALPSNMRNRSRKGKKKGLRVEHGGVELLDDFHSVFAVNMRDLGVPVYGKHFFRTILKYVPDAAALTCVYLEDRCIGGGFTLTYKGHCEVPWSSSLREYRNSYCSNMFLFWEMIARAADGGCRVFDFGRSPRGGPTCEFKKQWGSKEIDLHWHDWVPPGLEPPTMTTHSAAFRRKVALWKRLPLCLTKLLGPRIVRGIP